MPPLLWMITCVYLCSCNILSFMQDLEDALPLIQKYKDQLVAIGEVIILYL